MQQILMDWCADAWDGAPLTARSFGHPQGMCYVGRAGAFLYLPVPKVATTVGRQWAAAAYGEEAGAPAPWLIPAAAKPPADRLDGATLSVGQYEPTGHTEHCSAAEMSDAFE